MKLNIFTFKNILLLIAIAYIFLPPSLFAFAYHSTNSEITIYFDDENTIDDGGSCPPRSQRPVVTELDVNDMKIDVSNKVNAKVTDPDGDLDIAYLFVKSPSTKTNFNKVFYEPMSCTGTGYNKTCTASVKPLSNWGDDALIAVAALDSCDLGEYATKIVKIIKPSPTPVTQSPTPTSTDGASTPSPNVRPTVTILSGDLKRYQGNLIAVTVTDPDRDANAQAVIISVRSPSADTTFKVENQKMICSGTSSNLNCTYVVTPDSQWGNDALISVIAMDKVGPSKEVTKIVSVTPEFIPTPSPSPTLTPSPTPTPSPSPAHSPVTTPTQTLAVPTTQPNIVPVSPTVCPTNSPSSTISPKEKGQFSNLFESNLLILLIFVVCFASIFFIYYLKRKTN